MRRGGVAAGAWKRVCAAAPIGRWWPAPQLIVRSHFREIWRREEQGAPSIDDVGA